MLTTKTSATVRPTRPENDAILPPGAAAGDRYHTQGMASVNR